MPLFRLHNRGEEPRWTWDGEAEPSGTASGRATVQDAKEKAKCSYNHMNNMTILDSPPDASADPTKTGSESLQ